MYANNQQFAIDEYFLPQNNQFMVQQEQQQQPMVQLDQGLPVYQYQEPLEQLAPQDYHQWQHQQNAFQGVVDIAPAVETNPVPFPDMNQQFPAFPQQDQFPVNEFPQYPYEYQNIPVQYAQGNQDVPYPIPPTVQTTAALPVWTLVDQQKWQFFHSRTNEMAVANFGKLINPCVTVLIRNLEMGSNYYISMKLQLVSQNKFKLVKNGESERWEEEPVTGEMQGLVKETIEKFYYVKSAEEMQGQPQKLEAKIYNIGSARKKASSRKNPLTEEELEKERQNAELREFTMLKVTPQFKYIPVLSLYKVSMSGHNLVSQFSFRETEFVVSTGYKSTFIIENKVSIYSRKDTAAKKRKATEPLENPNDAVRRPHN